VSAGAIIEAITFALVALVPLFILALRANPLISHRKNVAAAALTSTTSPARGHTLAIPGHLQDTQANPKTDRTPAEIPSAGGSICTDAVNEHGCSNLHPADCPSCEGQGGYMRHCQACNGTGCAMCRQQGEIGVYCETCGGSGRMEKEEA